MTIAVKHAFTSTIADDSAAAAAGKLLPSHWNATHTLTAAAVSLLGNPTATADAAVSEVTLGTGLGFSGGQLVNTMPAMMPAQPAAATLTNDLVATTETVVASVPLTANAFAAGALFNLRFLGQVSSTATLIFRVRIGTAGTTADALAATFATSAAGVANGYVSGDILIAGLTAGTSGTVTAGGHVQLVNAVLGPASAAFAAATVNTTVANYVTLTLVQSAAQTYTSRAACLSRMI